MNSAFACIRAFLGRPAWLALVAPVVLLFGATQHVWSQANPQANQAIVRQLIGTSVSEIGPQYADLEKAVTQFGNGDVEGATQILADVKAKNPELPPAGVMLANLFVLAKNQNAARSALEKAIQDDPNDPEAYVVFGDDAFQRRQFAEAELFYDKGLKAAETYAANEVRKKMLTLRGLSGKAAVLEARQYWDQAVPLLEQVTTINPENVALQIRLSRALFKSGKREDAYKKLQELYDKNPEVDRPEINAAKLFQQEDLDPNAKKMIDLALERDPNTMRTQLAAAQWALETGRIDMAKQCAAAAAKLEGNQLSVKLLEGVLARYDRDFAKAEAAFQEAHLMSPANPVAINQMALVLIEQADEEKQQRALEYAQLNTRQFGETNNASAREATITLAWVLYKAGRLIEAERAVLATIQQTKLTGDSAYFAAQILKERGRDDLARQILEGAIEQKGVFPTLDQAKSLMTELSGAP